MRGMLRIAQLLAQRLEGRIVAVVAVDVMQQAAQLVPRCGIDPAVLFQTVFGAGFELVEVPAGFGDADHRHVEMAVLHHRLQRGEYLLVGKIAGRAEKDQRVRMNSVHGALAVSLSFPGDRQIRNAWRRAACRQNRPARAS